MRVVAVASDRELQRFAVGWVFSVARMPDDDMKDLLQSHYPTVAQVMHRREEHEIASGHSLKGWETFLNYAPEESE
jgi:hypothetical protein